MGKAKMATVNELLKEIKKLKKENKYLKKSVREINSNIYSICDRTLENFDHFAEQSKLKHLRTVLMDVLDREVSAVRFELEEIIDDHDDVDMSFCLKDHSCE